MLAAEVQSQFLGLTAGQMPRAMTTVSYITHQIERKFIRPRAALRKLLPPPPWSSETVNDKARRIKEELATETKMSRRRSRRNGVSSVSLLHEHFINSKLHP